MPAKLREMPEVAAKPTIANGSDRQHGPVVSDISELLAIDDIRYQLVEVPEWGRTVRLVSLSGLDRNRLARASAEHAKRLKGGEDEAQLYFQARVILASIVDEDGRHIGDQSQAAALMEKNGGALTRLFLACARLSGIGAEAEDEAIDDLKATPSGATGSD